MGGWLAECLYGHLCGFGLLYMEASSERWQIKRIYSSGQWKREEIAGGLCILGGFGLFCKASYR